MMPKAVELIENFKSSRLRNVHEITSGFNNLLAIQEININNVPFLTGIIYYGCLL
tara:strand:+ start:343 stop:507 length:165 start_codon:yes stop_codon:yes gene_type:complete